MVEEPKPLGQQILIDQCYKSMDGIELSGLINVWMTESHHNKSGHTHLFYEIIINLLLQIKNT